MSTKTKNLELIKPELTDVADITATNGNWDKIDDELQKRASLEDGKLPFEQLPDHAHTISEISDFPTAMTPTSHTHKKSDISDFPTSMPASDVYPWAKESAKPSYSKAEVGLGNVANERQYSAQNPPPYPVSSVNGKTGEVTLGASDVGASATGHKHYKSEIVDFPTAMTPTSHTHKKSEITDFPTAMPASDVYSWAKASSKPTYTASEVGASPTGHKHTKSEITDFPSAMPPSAHTHKKSEITDFPTSMPASDVSAWAKASTKPSYTWSEIADKPGSFTPSSHTHDDRYYTETEVNNLVNTKAPAYQYSTTDLTAGSSSLATGTLYFVYE